MPNASNEEHHQPTPIKPKNGARFSNEFLKALTLRLVDYAGAVDIFLFESGTRLLGSCPLHDDTNPSFAVFGADHDRWGCYPCELKGNVFDLSMALGRSKSFPEAVEDVAGVLGVKLPARKGSRRGSLASVGSKGHKHGTKSQTHAPAELTEDQKFILLASRYAFRLGFRNDCVWRDQIVNELGISFQSLNRAARGISGLGVCDGRLAYVFPSGLKVRNSPGSKIRFYWKFGTALAPWRFERVKPTTKLIYLTESESDAIALIASGVEDDRHSVVVACSGTSGFQQSWGKLFSGKSVIICFDWDSAGRKAARKVARILYGHAASVKIVSAAE